MRTGTLFGFQVVVNPVWLLVFALLMVSLVTSLAGTGPDDLPGPAAVGVSAVVVALFLASIVAHELAHAAVARRRGLPDRDVQLLTLGRPPEAAPDPVSPRTEAAVSSAGPLLSGAVGGALLLNLANFGPLEQRIFTQADIVGLQDLLDLDPGDFRERIGAAAFSLRLEAPTDLTIEGWYQQAQTLEDQ